jgi:hypothetical protein
MTKGWWFEELGDEDKGHDLDPDVALAMSFLLGASTPRTRPAPSIISAMGKVHWTLGVWSNADSIYGAVIDLQPSVDRFTALIGAFDTRGWHFPCAEFGKGPPVPIDPIAHPDFPGFGTGDSAEEFHAVPEMPKLALEGLDIKGYPAQEAAVFGLSRLWGFLRSRLSAVRGRRGGGGSGHKYIFVGGSPGVMFRITTNSHGLRVYNTHAYFMNPSYVFGAPTSPVDSFISPGLWLFGIKQNNGKVKFETQIYDVPKDSSGYIPV